MRVFESGKYTAFMYIAISFVSLLILFNIVNIFEVKASLYKTSSTSKDVEKIQDAEGHKDFYVNRDEFEREERKGQKCEDFKEELLKNAPKKDKDFIIAEKGSWKK